MTISIWHILVNLYGQLNPKLQHLLVAQSGWAHTGIVNSRPSGHHFDNNLNVVNVRYGSKAAVITHRCLRPLSGAKRTKSSNKRTSQRLTQLVQ